MKILLINIKELVQVREATPFFLKGNEMATLPTIKNAWLLIKGKVIEDFGPMETLPKGKFDHILDCTNRLVMPCWCDSHSHIVYAGNREDEFVDRIKGLTYQEIANRGGGILNSAKKLEKTSEKQLYREAAVRLEELIYQGTGALEIKSGYGLSTSAELKMLRVIKKLSKKYPIAIKATFLGAHAVPEKFKNNKEGYINLICEEMIPQIAAQNLAEYIDVFCEEGYFNTEDTQKIIQTGKKFGLIPKIHVNQFNAIGGVTVGVKNEALSVDHLEVVTEEDVQILKNTKTMPVALPGCSFFLEILYTPARKLLENDLPLALATDYNPGSCPSGNMNLVVALACIKMKLTPEEAINAATINGAYAMGLLNTHGSITKGKIANVFITEEIPSYAFIPYSFGTDLINQVIINGQLL